VSHPTGSAFVKIGYVVSLLITAAGAVIAIALDELFLGRVVALVGTLGAYISARSNEADGPES
jgi:hypothetical protein